MMNAFDKSRVGRAYELVRACWEDIARMCQYWTTDDGQASQSDWAYARQIYKESKLNQNRIALYDLTRGDGLNLEIESELLGMSDGKAKTDKYLDILKTVYKEVDRIDGRISQYFDRTESSEDLPKDKFIRQEVEFILDAMWDIKYELYPRIKDELIMERGNLFDGVDKKKVIEFFGQLTTKHNPNKKPYMTDFEFKNLMNRAFSSDTNIPMVRIEFDHAGDRKAITELFHFYYVGCKEHENVAKRDKDIRESYVRLLTENICGYSFKTTLANFAASSSGNWMKWKDMFYNGKP